MFARADPYSDASLAVARYIHSYVLLPGEL